MSARCQFTCWCGDYPFPHRLLGGKCRGGPNEEPVPYLDRGNTVEDYERHWGDRTAIDNRLDDPRRGEAAAINAENRRFRFGG